MKPPLTTAEQVTLKKKSSSSDFFSWEELQKIREGVIPKHIAIIPDGNRRWASKRQSSQEKGHEQGADITIDIVKAASEIGIEAITLYTFSTENWFRPQKEVDALMWLIESYLKKQKKRMIKEGIRLTTIGCSKRLSPSLRKAIADTQKATREGSKIDLILAINYGGRDEITRAVREIVAEVGRGNLEEKAITEETICRYLDSYGRREPELMIRTSGEMRISNFLIWQLAYSEIVVSDVLWPDFSPAHLYSAVVEYQRRERRLGG